MCSPTRLRRRAQQGRRALIPPPTRSRRNFTGPPASPSLAALSSFVAFVACGARSHLPECLQPGATQGCENACGTGVQVCYAGDWGPCEVPPASRECSNACGEGSQLCEDGGWSPCDVPLATRACTSACGTGEQQCTDGGWGNCDAAQPGPPTFAATVRDFLSATDPDFEPDSAVPGVTPGIVEADLGADETPVYAGNVIAGTHGAALFAAWYHDMPPLNATLPTPLLLALTPSAADPSLYAYLNDAFFPIDNQLLGNEGRPHNFDFTVQLTAIFRYTGGETFEFGSDDDSFVFLNRRLAVDLGGIHSVRTGSVNLDAQSQYLGIVTGNLYPMHLFYAERHVWNAALRISVPAGDFAVCPDGTHP